MLVQIGGTPTGQTPQVASAVAAGVEEHPAITADPAAKLTLDAPTVTTEAAPPPMVVEPPATTIIPVVYQPAPPAAPAPVYLASAAAAPPPPPQPPAASTKAAQIAAAARAQIGIWQDCVAMTARALRAVGIDLYDWPAGYLTLGPQVPYSEAIPGDLIYYRDGGAGLAHIAVYDGNGMAIHGGYNGNQTVRFTVFVGSGPVFIRVL